MTNYVMKMPASYVEVSREEMEYEDGGVWFVVCGALSIACSAASLLIDIGCATGALKMDKETQRNINRGLAIAGTVFGVASGLGYIYCVGGNIARGALGLADTVFSDVYTTATW